MSFYESLLDIAQHVPLLLFPSQHQTISSKKYHWAQVSQKRVERKRILTRYIILLGIGDYFANIE
jgi:hypothetical protein